MSEITDDYRSDTNVHKLLITAEAGNLSGSGTKIATFWYVTEENLPGSILDSDNPKAEAAGGGTIRFSTDSGGENQLNVHVLDFTPASGGAGGGATAKIRINVGSYTGGSSKEVYIWWITGGSQTQPAASATYGSDGVYTANGSYGAEWKFTENPAGSAPQMLDSTANNNDGTSNGSMVAGDQVDLVLTSGIDFAGGTSNQCINVPDNDSLSFNSATGLSAGFWFNVGSQSGYRTFISKRNNSLAVDAEWLVGHNQSLNIVYAAFYDGAYFDLAVSFTSNFAINTLYFLGATWQQSGADVVLTLYKNGAQIGQTTHTNKTITTNTAPVTIGCTKYATASFDEELDGTIALPFLYHGLLDADEWLTLYNNQSDPGSFWAVGTVEDGPFVTGNPVSALKIASPREIMEDFNLGEVA